MEPALTHNDNWSFSKKIFFRFFCIYFFLYIFPFPLDFYSEWSSVKNYYDHLWDPLVSWVGKNVLHIGNDFELRGGDSPFRYVQLFSKLSLAILLCLIWTLMDRKRNSYNKLFYWLRVYVRYYLAFVMLGYGVAKFFHMQFSGFSDLNQLVTPKLVGI